MRATLLVSILAFALCTVSPGVLSAHKLQQLRIVHIIVKGQRVECYINFLLPKGPKSRLWQRMFDRNRDRRISAKEQRALGKFLQRLVRRKLRLTWQGKALPLLFKEVQNSRLRGNALKGALSWDYRFSGRAPAYPRGKAQRLSLYAPALAPRELTPVALVALGGLRLKATKHSYILRRAGVDRAVCKMSKKRRTCRFVLYAAPLSAPTRQPPPRPTSRPSPGRPNPVTTRD